MGNTGTFQGRFGWLALRPPQSARL
jgi:hypothetical protein